MISKRLKAILSLINNEEKIIDIGCDHALIDIHSIKASKTKYALAIDNNKLVVDEAYKNVLKHNANVEVMLNDGIKNLIINPNDLIIISGLGTRTILKILSDKNINNINRMIIQSNNDQYALRKELTKKFFIEKEIVVKDKHKYYVIAYYKRGYKKYSFMDLYMGPFIRKSDVEYMSYIRDKFNKIAKQNKNKNIVKYWYLKIIIYFISKDIKNV